MQRQDGRRKVYAQGSDSDSVTVFGIMMVCCGGFQFLGIIRFYLVDSSFYSLHCTFLQNPYNELAKFIIGVLWYKFQEIIKKGDAI